MIRLSRPDFLPLFAPAPGAVKQLPGLNKLPPCVIHSPISGISHAMTTCNICGMDALARVAAYSRLARVTSDCKPFPAGGELAICQQCGGVQKPATSSFLADIAVIYAGYDVYFQGGGVEQMSLDIHDGVLKRRSDLIVERLLAAGALAARGVVLDFGCGNGAMLAAIARKAPGWTLEGTELDARSEAHLAAIPGFSRLYVAGQDQVPDARFDVITMIHALEHLTAPLTVLTDLARKLKPGGLLFIESPNLKANPFDLLIADHATHFTPQSIERLLARAGFALRALHTDWVSKELSVVAASADVNRDQWQTEDADTESALAWIGGVSRRASALAAKKPVVVFGTSIAATWLTADLGVDRVAMYVDEDPARQGRIFNGKPVVAPAHVPKGETVFVCLAPGLAETVAARLSAQGVRCEM